MPAPTALSAIGVNLDRLYHGQPATTDASIYTPPGTVQGATLGRVLVQTCVVANPSPAAIKVRLALVPSGGSADTTHPLLGDVSIPANTTSTTLLGTYLRPGDALYARSESLPAPSGVTATGSTTGGTLAASSYVYKVTGTNANGETAGSAEVAVTTTGATSSVVLTWNQLLGVTGYKIYRGTTVGSEVALATVSGSATVTYADTGSATTSGAPPTTGTAGGCTFTISGAELPA